jgi:hypothetical protein
MTSVAPPTEFFPGIDFNPSFYNLGQSAVTLDYLNLIIYVLQATRLVERNLHYLMVLLILMKI